MTGAGNLLELGVGQDFLQFVEAAGIIVAAIDHEGRHSVVLQYIVIDYSVRYNQANRSQRLGVLRHRNGLRLFQTSATRKPTFLSTFVAWD